MLYVDIQCKKLSILGTSYVILLLIVSLKNSLKVPLGYGSTGSGYQSCSWSSECPLPSFAPEYLAARDRFDRPVPRQPAHSPHSGRIWCLPAGSLPLSATASIFTFTYYVVNVVLYGCVTWTLSPGDFDKLREAHRGMLLRCLNAYTSTRAAPDYHMLSYLEVLLRTDCECIEATVMKRILHYAGRVARGRS